MITFAIIVFFLVVVLSFFLNRIKAFENYISTISGISISIVLGLFLSVIFQKPWDVSAVHEIKWIELSNIGVHMGLHLSTDTLLLLITLLSVFLFLILSDAKVEKKNYMHYPYLLSLVFLLSLAILSLDIVTFLLSWIVVGIIDCRGFGEKFDSKAMTTKLFYTGLDNSLMLFGMLLISIVSDSTYFSVMNTKLGELSGDSALVAYIGVSIVALSIMMRGRLFPFISGGGRYISSSKLYFNSSQILTILPLGVIAIYKLHAMTKIPFLSEAFFVCGMLSAIFALVWALEKADIRETLFLSTIAMMGLVYSAISTGMISTALILLVATQLLKAPINVLLSSDGNKSTDKTHFWIAAIVLSAYAGIPGFANFFIFFDVLLGFFNMENFNIPRLVTAFVFFLLNGLIGIKMLLNVFDVKKIFSQDSSKEKTEGRFLLAIFPALLSCVLLFYSIPSNLTSNDAYKFKNMLSPFSKKLDYDVISLQFQNIVMILLLLCIIIGLSLGFYLYFIKASEKIFIQWTKQAPFLQKLGKATSLLNGFIFDYTIMAKAANLPAAKYDHLLSKRLSKDWSGFGEYKIENFGHLFNSSLWTCGGDIGLYGDEP